MYSYPVNISLGPFGYIYMATYKSTSKLLKLFKIQLHNTTHKLGLVKSDLPSIANMFYYDGIFLHSNEIVNSGFF